MRQLLLLAPACGALILLAAGRPPDLPFDKHTLHLGAGETAALADVNGDGRIDLLSGEHWFESVTGPAHRYRELPFSGNYVDAFSDLPLDVNADGRVDVITCSWFSKKMVWYENPGAARQAQWTEHPIDSGASIEFAFLVDLDNDGKTNEILPQFGDENVPLAWFEVRGGKVVKHTASPRSYGHGIGAGDVNGDGRNDILTPKGWLEAPADPRTGDWKLHPGIPEGPSLSFLHVFDVNGDGRNDIISSHAHDYGIFWLEQGEAGQWTKRIIDDSWSQGHALTLADLNSDRQPDLVTGKRYMAHNGRDPGEREPLGIYWYEFRRSPDKKVEWIRHLVDYGTRTGGGMQIPVADFDRDGDADFVVAGKSGLFLFQNMSGKKEAEHKISGTR